jgi:hypothetical protein
LQRKVTAVILTSQQNAAKAYGNVSQREKKAMKAASTKKPLIRFAVVESDPLRFVGLRALFDSEPGFRADFRFIARHWCAPEH